MTERDVLVGDRYRLVERIGSGAMGVVWEGWDERLERRVALKLLHRQPGLSEEDLQLANDRAMREARISARLHHRYAVPVFDVVDHHGQPCLVMQYVPSMPLSAVLREGGPLQPAEAAQAGAQVAAALAAAHQLGIVHRDVKPGNVLIAEDGSAMICDFGISHALGDATLTQTGLIHGTPAYLAPEVARGGASSPASDVFSLGATLYSALEGTPPFGTDANAIALLYRVAGGSFDPPQRSGALAPLLVAMLAASPEDRPAMTQVAQQFSDHRLGPSTPVATPAPPPPREPTELVPPPPDNPPTLETGQPTVARAVVSPTPDWSRPPPPSVKPGPAPNRSRRRTIVAVVAAVAAVLIIVTAAIWQRPDGAAVTNPSPSPTTSSAPRTPTGSSTPSTPATSSAPPTPSPTASTPSISTAPGSGTPTAAELTQAITEYYALMPKGTDQAWPRMTTRYQSVTSGGRAAYERFWGAIRSVSLSKVTGKPPGTVTATLDYTYKDGRVSTERTTFRLVRDDGILKIDGSQVG